MRARALLVERHQGERTRQALVERGALRSDLAILHEGDRLAFPLRTGAVVPSEWGEIADREFVPRAVDPGGEFRDRLPWPEAERALVPRSFDVVGEIVLIRLPAELEARRFEVGAALLAFVPGARLVGLDRGVRGPDRRRSVERIAGTGPWTTRHRENGLEFDVDLEAAYFSPRLAREHALVAAQVGPGEEVLDLCCGVGPFATTIARDGRARRIVAVDANPAAIALLRRTLARYPFGHRVKAVTARLEAFAPSAGAADRIVLNLPHEGIKYAALVAPLLSPGGRLHFYEVVPRDEVARRGTVIERTLPVEYTWSVEEPRVVHPYSPASDLVAWTARRTGG